MYLTTHLICCGSCKIHIQVFQTTVSHFEQQNLFVLYSNTLLQTVFFVHELIYVFQINGTLINAREAVNFKIREINAYATPKKCQEFVENRNKFILTLQTWKIQTRIVHLSLNVWFRKIPTHQLVKKGEFGCVKNVWSVSQIWGKNNGN